MQAIVGGVGGDVGGGATRLAYLAGGGVDLAALGVGELQPVDQAGVADGLEEQIAGPL